MREELRNGGSDAKLKKFSLRCVDKKAAHKRSRDLYNGKTSGNLRFTKALARGVCELLI